MDVDLGAGEGLAITGPSGVGKSTLLRVLAMLEPCARGEVLLDGAPVAPARIPAFRSRVLYLPQSPLRLAGSLLDNLKAPFGFAANAGATWDGARARELAGRLGLSETLLARNAGELSGGEAQRMALARALLLDPRVLLLDEPTASLDGDSQAAAEQLVAEWRAGDGARALVLVSHDADQRGRMTSRALALTRPDGPSAVARP